MAVNSNRPISEAFVAIVGWATSLGAKNLKDLPGCWEHDLGEYRIAINGHPEETECSYGPSLAPFSAYVECNGWPFAAFGAYGGTIMSETPDAEDRLVDALRVATPLQHFPEGLCTK